MIKLENVSKSYGNREIIKIDKLEIYDGDKIGIVGKNGAGKSTLFDIITKDCIADTGKIDVKGKIGYIKQFNYTLEPNLSGGEIEKAEINKVLKENPDIILADEPSSNLDIASIQYLIKRFKEFIGTILLISHDRRLLDEVCSKIIEIDNSKINIYLGNYTDYKNQKEMEIKTKEDNYIKYIKEKEKLEKAINISKNTAKNMKKTPSRMGNSEARLHKREAENKREKLEGHTKALESRLEKLDQPDRPIHELPVYMRVPESQVIRAKIVISGEKDAVAEAETIAKEMGAKKVVVLKTAGPFHTQKLLKVSQVFKNDLEKVTFSEFTVPVIKNLDGTVYKKEDNIKEILEKHIISPVRFSKSLETMLDMGIDTFIEVGPGKTLSGFAKRIKTDKEIKIRTVPNG
mgnify:CR=1 FL=1